MCHSLCLPGAVVCLPLSSHLLVSIPTTRTTENTPLLPGPAEQPLTYSGSGLGPVQGADDDEAEAFVLFPVNDHVAGLQAVGSEALGGGGAAAGGRVVAVGVGGVVTAWRAVVG